MKHSDHNISNRRIAALLLWLVPLALLVPNIALDITEISYTAVERIINITLPAGIWLLVMALPRRTGLPALCMLPVMVLCAFQIVLLFLYGESIIAVDMFLNVMTTNVHEATELLCSLGSAIAFVCLLYLPLLVLAAIATAKGAEAPVRQRRVALYAGIASAAAGLLLLAGAIASAGYRPTRRLFPLNVICNIFTAGERTSLADNYNQASAKFRFHATNCETECEQPVIVLVIGETSRADNWQLNGYGRATNPRLSRRDGIVSFHKTLSESNTTHKSVPLIMSHLDGSEFGDSIYCSRGIIDAFREAGYTTAWLSAQQRNGQLIDFYGCRADTVHFITDDGLPHHDMELGTLLAHILSTEGSRPVFAVLHTYGSHFDYKERYPAGFDPFGHIPDTEARPDNRTNLIDAYDNSISYTDAVLDSIISAVEATARPAAMVYVADHGEDIYDDSRERFLHASPTPTYWQLHVPMVVWMNRPYRTLHPERYAAAIRTRDKDVSSSRSVFHTLLSLAAIASPYYNAKAALTEAAYTEPTRQYLNDYNEAVPLYASGLRDEDFDCLLSHGISTR